MPPYERRILDLILDELLPALPAVAIEGAKGVGKTATATRRAQTVLRLDDAATRDFLRANPDSVMNAGLRPVLIDEWQRVPELWDRVRRLVDDGAPPGSYLLTGSATPVTAPVHSGAGRIDTLRMRPLSLAERFPTAATVSLATLLSGRSGDIEGETDMGLSDYTHEILRSGFPGIHALSGRALRTRLDGYLENVVRREFPEQGLQVRRPATLRAWLRAYAAATSTTSSYATILAASTPRGDGPPAKTTTIAYRDTLSQLWLLDPVDAWQPGGSELGRIAKAPKHQLADPALAARLLDLTDDDFAPGRRGAPLLGHLFDHLVTMSVRTYAMATEARIGYFRAPSGEHEVDIIIERAGRVIAIEVKLSRSVDDHDVRHLLWLRERLGDRFAQGIVITTGPYAYRRADGIAVVPAALLGP